MIHRRVGAKWRALLNRVRRYVLHNVLHADDPPHRLAMGVGIAMFVTFTPTVGVQMPLTVFFSWLLRGNKLVGLPIVWISNPATLIPIYFTCYTVGRKLLAQEPVGGEWWRQLAHPPTEWWPMVSFYWSRCTEIAAPLWLGGIVIGGILAVPSYYAALYCIRSYRLKRWGQLTPPNSDDAT